MRKKWLPYETPNWSRNTSILNAQWCASQEYLLSKSASLSFPSLLWMQQDGIGTGRCSQSKGADSSQARLARWHMGLSVPSPRPHTSSAEPADPSPGSRTGSESGRWLCASLVHMAAAMCGAETEAGVVKSTCSISHLRRATQSSD